MTERVDHDAQARQKLLELDRRYRLILGSVGIADLIANSAADKRTPEVQLEYSATEREIDQLRAAHPNLLRKLEAQFWEGPSHGPSDHWQPC